MSRHQPEASQIVEAAARFVYSALLRLLTPAILLRYWWRGRAEGGYRHALGERLGRYTDDAAPGAVWVHAVSLGETRAAKALVDALRERVPAMRLLLTHGTATGREAGRALLRAGDMQVWLPLDTPGATRRFFAHFRPALGVLMETEVWPNLIHAAHRARIPVVLANARLSEKSRRKGERFAWLLRPALARLSLTLAQTDDDARRLRESGAAPVQVSGNLKFDLTPDPAQLARGRAWRDALAAPPGGTFGHRPVVLAASTREGEEAPLLAAWLQLAPPRPLLLLVPRHPQRFDEADRLVREAGLSLRRRSEWADRPPADAAVADVWLGDSLGEMATYYAAAHVALLGGSFAPLGGQNLIEAAACGCPVVMGPHTFNFADAAELAIMAGAALRVDAFPAAIRCAIELFAARRHAVMRAAATGFAAAHRGAVGRMAAAIDALPAARTPRTDSGRS